MSRLCECGAACEGLNTRCLNCAVRAFWEGPAITTGSTLCILKPDCLKAGHVGAVISIIEANGFEIARLRKDHPSADIWADFYAEHNGAHFFGELVEHMASGPVILMRIDLPNAVPIWRHLLGSTDPRKARPGTVRHLYGNKCGDIRRNVAHGSDSEASAARELSFFFGGVPNRDEDQPKNAGELPNRDAGCACDPKFSHPLVSHRVWHNIYGKGCTQSVCGEQGDDAESIAAGPLATVVFLGYGPKTVRASYLRTIYPGDENR